MGEGRLLFDGVQGQSLEGEAPPPAAGRFVSGAGGEGEIIYEDEPGRGDCEEGEQIIARLRRQLDIARDVLQFVADMHGPTWSVARRGLERIRALEGE